MKEATSFESYLCSLSGTLHNIDWPKHVPYAIKISVDTLILVKNETQSLQITSVHTLLLKHLKINTCSDLTHEFALLLRRHVLHKDTSIDLCS